MTALEQERLSGLCEYMPPPERQVREQRLLELLEVELTGAGGTMEVGAVLEAVAARYRIAISQVKHGLNRGLAFGSLRFESTLSEATVSLSSKL